MPFLILTIALALLAACGGGEGGQNAAELANGAELGEGVAPSEAGAANAQTPGPMPASFAVGPLQVPYDAALLAPVAVKVQLPPDWKRSVQGIKLIGRDRAALIGEAECLYGQSGQASRCNAAQEAGLSFARLETGFDALAAKLPAAERRTVVLGGVEGLSWEIGAEGEGAEHILLPAGERAILIVRQFRNTGNPDEAALGTVLGDLSLDR